MSTRWTAGRALARGSLLVAVTGAWGCHKGPVDPGLPELEVLVAGGDGQYGTVGQALADQLHAVVRVAETGLPLDEVTVQWEVEQGGATLSGTGVTVSDENGAVYASLTLGSSAGEVLVRVHAVAQEAASVVFHAYAVDTPELTSLSASSAAPGETITITGANFSPVAEQDVVLFSGIRGAVVQAQATALDVTVPTCLPARTVGVTVQLGQVASGALPLDVTGGGDAPRDLSVGEIVDVDDDAGLTCLRLAGGSGVSYLALVASSGTVGAATYGYTLVGLADGGVVAQPPPGPESGPATVLRTSWQARWHDFIRTSEAELGGVGAAWPTGPGPARAPAAVPALGDRRTFHVLRSDGGFDDVVAVAQYIGTRGVLYVDEASPDGGFDASDLQAFSDRFDEIIYPTDTAAFGAASDLDGNQRVVILLTPAVNKLTPKGTATTQGYIGGFFYGLDLLTEREHSNQGEVFYALVPDPDGQVADAHSKSQVLSVVPAILAHEFQHMIHFNQRVLELGASGTDALWLQEGLAQAAEELSARAYDALGDGASAELFRSGNRARMRRYLADPSDASLIVTAGQGSLEERGAGVLHFLYLADRFGDGVLRDITQTTLTGVANVTTASGLAWQELTSDWWGALYLDGILDSGGRMEYTGMDLRTYVGGSYPLMPQEVGGSDFDLEGSLWSSSAQYYLVTPPGLGSVALRLAGPSGGLGTPAGAVRLRIVRLP